MSSIKEYVKRNKIQIQMVDELAELLGIDTVSKLPSEFIEYLGKVKKDIDEDLKELTPAESIEYLTILLISYMAGMHLRIKELIKKQG